MEAQGLAETTAVVMHSDHGWHLGEYNMWEKRTLWENAVHVPLIVRVPWLPHTAGTRSESLVELVDVYPTVCDLLGVELPAADAYPVEGTSLVPLLTGDSEWTKTAALSTYPRCPSDTLPAWDRNSCIHSTERTDFAFMGYSMRVDITHPDSGEVQKLRFTEWYPWNGTVLMPNTGVVRATELYNHTALLPQGASNFDLYENINLAHTAEPALLSTLRVRLHREFGI